MIYNSRINRRNFLFTIFLLAAGLPVLTTQAQPQWKKEIISYISKLAKEGGGYGWEDQPDAHLTPTFALTGVLYHIDALPENKAPLIQFIRTHHPQRGGSKETGPAGSQIRNLTYQQIQSILWLGGDVSDFTNEVKDWKSQAGNLSNYEMHGYASLTQEVMTPLCRSLLKIPLTDIDKDFTAYLEKNRRQNGSFNNAPASEGGDGNILNTYWSLYALDLLSGNSALKAEATNWLQSCQMEGGSFTHQPRPEIGANDEVIYTWAAVKSLHLLGAKPLDTQSCIRYLLSLRNSDGGFGNRPGLPSTSVSTYYAVDALKVLDGFSSLAKAPSGKKPAAAKQPDFTGYKIFTVQFEASGSGSLQEAVALADRLGIHLWGAKNAAPGWLAAAQKIADEKGVPVTFFTSSEPYNKNLAVPGMGSFGHILDYIAPAKANIRFNDSSSFKDFSSTTLPALQKANGGLILQITNNEPLARILLDESVKNGFYLAISTIHFGQNFSFFLPYLHEYRHQLPFITLQDAHGTESWWWATELTNHRTLFIAREPTYDAMIQALKNNWVVAARHDSISDYRTRMLGGTMAARQFITSNEKNWKWWQDPKKETPQLWAAITVVHPNDSFEVARPDKGVSIRIRCRWNSVRETLKAPLVELQQLTVDDVIVTPELITKKNRKGDIADAYYVYLLPVPSKGTHRIKAVLKELKTGAAQTMTTSFVQN